MERFPDTKPKLNNSVVDIKSYKEISNTTKVALAKMDVLEFLKTVDEPFATLIVTSPPYNIGKISEMKN